MDKIAFKNGQAPALSAEILNLLQQNVENAIEIVKSNLEQKINGTVLYEKEVGTTANITLTDNISNYNKIEIIGYFYHGEGQIGKFCRQFDIDLSEKLELAGISYNGGSYTYLVSEVANIKGNLIERGKQYEVGIGADVVPIRATGEYVYITKAIGYK